MAEMTDLVKRLRALANKWLLGDEGALVSEAADEIERLRGVIASDDERLKQAALRVWGEHIWGCDTPDMMAEKIECLRARFAELEGLLRAYGIQSVMED